MRYKNNFLCLLSAAVRGGGDIAQLIMDTLEEHAITLSDCRAQGYDNADNMAEKYKGAQAKIEEQNSEANVSPCG